MLKVEYADVTVKQTIRPSELVQTIIAMLAADQPLMIWGPPGVGKSDICQQVAQALNYIYHDIRPTLMERIDLLGVPYVNDMNHTMWASPGFLPDQNSEQFHFINLEELPNAKPDMQSALYQLVLDRACGEYRLPSAARLVACGNRRKDRGGTYRLAAPLASRFLHVEIEKSTDDWLTWAESNDVDPDVMFFIRFSPDYLHLFDPKGEDPAYACPRTWAALSNIRPHISAMDEELQRTLFRGTVGETAAAAFCAFLEMKQHLPHPKNIIHDPLNARIPENASAKVTLASSLCRLADEFNIDAICQYASRLDPEINSFLVNQCVARNPDLVGSAAYTRWAERPLVV